MPFLPNIGAATAGVIAARDSLPQDWTFQQLEGDRTKLVLSDSAAPHGRPRQKPITKDKLMVRQNVTRYPGSNSRPTRHILGSHREDQELTGRWQDNKLGAGRAQSLVLEFEKFVAAQVQCRISWGDINHWTGIIESIETSWESATQVAWTLHIGIDRKEDGQFIRKTRNEQLPDFKLDEPISNLVNNLKNLSLSLPDWSPDLLDGIDDAIAALNAPSAILNKFVNGVDRLADTVTADLNRARMSMNQIQTALVTLDNVLGGALLISDPESNGGGFGNDLALVARRADSDLKFLAARADAILEITYLKAIIADLIRTANVSQVGQTVTTFQARSGDSWESISIAVFGSPARANDIRKANAAKEPLPIPGKIYSIPT